MPPLSLEPWTLDYSWSTRQGPWTPNTDMLLECRTYTQIELSQLLSNYLAKLTAGTESMQDNKAQPGYWSGGVFLYISAQQDQTQPASQSYRNSLWLHSRGEDAMDSLAWESQNICKTLTQGEHCFGLNWIEHPHQRDYRIRAPRPAGGS